MKGHAERLDELKTLDKKIAELRASDLFTDTVLDEITALVQKRIDQVEKDKATRNPMYGDDIAYAE